MGRGNSPLKKRDMTAFEEYVDQYGCHFNSKLYEFAVSMMTGRDGNGVQPMPKDEVSSWLASHGVHLKNDRGHDAAYVRAMLYADCWGSSYTKESQLALGVMDFLDDPDGSPTKAFDHFVVDCRTKKEPIFWDEML